MLAVLVVNLRAQIKQGLDRGGPVSCQQYGTENGPADSSRVVSVAWVPNTEGTQFVAAHSCGLVFLYSKVHLLLLAERACACVNA